ncbi:MAG: peptide chain release factor 2 [Clostridia bacterium]|nr:peptide chain release factor 2 [Clostridia bacterium]
MIAFEELKAKFNEQQRILDGVGVSLGIEELEKKSAELQAKLDDQNLWTDMTKAQAIAQEAKKINNKLNAYRKLQTGIADALVLLDMADEMEAVEELDGLSAELTRLSADIEEMRLAALLKGEYDACDAILTLHAGAGGTEAQDWVSMLYRMYTRYAEKKGYQCKTIDYLAGDEAGIKSVTFELSGDNVYGYMKAEKGVHRLVRISPFDANSRRHTSFASLEVMPVIPDDGAIVINPEDLKIDTYRSGGAGGQHVNRTDSAVRITHLPTGIVVQCQNERSQIQNREVAMTMLRARLAEKKEREQLEKANEIKGELKRIEWGSQIRSYVFCPYTMVKDHRTGYETGNVQAVMDGDLDPFITEYLRKS